MTRSHVIAAAALAVAVAAARAGAAPATVPTSRPSAVTAAPTPAPVTTPRPMSGAFASLRYRSIFVKGSQSLGDPDGRGSAAAGPPAASARPEASLVFTGVVLVGDRPEAMVEDTAARRVFTAKVGDPVAAGRVTAITFDDLVYQPPGRAGIHIGVGQTFEGKAAAPSDTAAPSDGGGPPPVAGGGGGASALGVTSGMSADDILARMKKRREQELKGK